MINSDFKEEFNVWGRTFTYTVGGKTEKLFVIEATNRQMEREYPSKSGNQFDSKKADPSNIYGGYIPRKFPKGTWNITLFKEINDTEYGPYKIRTNATRNVVGYQQKYDENNILIGWKEIKNEMGENVPFEDGHLLIHGGTGRRIDKLNTIEKLDARKGDNDYLGTTHGCIRISNLDVLLIVETLKKYLEFKGKIELEVK